MVNLTQKNSQQHFQTESCRQSTTRLAGFSRFALGSFIALSLTACSNNGNLLQDNIVTGSINNIPKGYDCPINANNLYPVGAIYRRDERGVHYSVKDLSKNDLITKSMRRDVKISDYEITNRQKTNAEASVALLKKVVPGLSVNANAARHKTIAIDVTIKDIRANDIDDQTEDKVVAWLKDNVSIKPGSRYFLVRQAVKASAVSYVINQKDLSKIAGKAELEKVASGSANLSIRDNDGSLKLDQTFEPRITVCTKSAEITGLIGKKLAKK
ncbi:MAG: hypothetical protein DHS20C08_03440 [Rhodomicrobium sp.]|nr:MAG: hypothetical protein DHS20C08_03440 [Rhodomicrobium sp.]